MKIDQSICNDWTLSPLKNCIKACGLKAKIACAQSVSVARCAGVSCAYLYFFWSVFLASVSTGVFLSCCVHMHAFLVNGHCLYVRSQVFISLDSGRQITRPKAATHPSFHGLPKRAFNMHYSFPCCYSCTNQIFSCFPLLLLDKPWVWVSGKQGCGGDCGVACICRGTTLFSLNPSLSLMPIWMTLSPVYLHFLWCAVCHLKLVSLVFVCIFVYASLCAVVSGVLGCQEYWEK